MRNLDEVFCRITDERRRQEHWDENRPRGSLPDAEKPVEVWLLWMEEELSRARAAAYQSYHKSFALEHVLYMAALAVACLQFCSTDEFGPEDAQAILDSWPPRDELGRPVGV